MEDRNQILCAKSEDFRDGVTAFIEKLPARYSLQAKSAFISG